MQENRNCHRTTRRRLLTKGVAPMHDKTKQILRVLREDGEWNGWLGGEEVTITLDDTTQEAEITTSAGCTQTAAGDWELDEIVCSLME